MERIHALKKVGLWEDGDPVVGLRKVRTRFRVKSKKQLKAEAAQQPADGKSAGDDKAKS